MLNWTDQIITWYLEHINYYTVFCLMVIESSFIPFPSEIVIPPAAYKAAQGDMNILFVVLFGSVGALVGAIFNYYFAVYFGRKLIYTFSNTRIAKLMLLNPDSIEKAENYFKKYGRISTLIGRLVPAVRQLISIPAGLSGMKFKDFIVYTAIGACFWNIILALLGYFLYSQKELLDKNYKLITHFFIIIGISLVLYLIYKSFKNSNKENIYIGK